ncbi:MAG TPA: tetratricopeptide repeat protein [Fluviicola sp.]|nr:tetratricopeptide repeat protein [Fluviicola sp.]
MKNYMLIAVSFFLGSLAFGQTLEEALKKTDNERYELAKQDYRSLIAKDPAKAADYYFYLGQNFFQQGELDSAFVAWQKGSSMDAANPLGMVGSGNVLWHKGDTAGARKQFVAACAATKHKNAEIMRQVASTYTYAKVQNIDAAIKLLNDAVKLEPKNVEGHLILGDALLEKTPANGSPAIAEYNKVLDLDAKNCKGIVRKAKLYQRAKNYDSADELYKEAQALDPTYAPAYRENAELNMLQNKQKEAIENWKKYLELNNSDEARYRFATSLYLSRRYCDAITEFEGLHSRSFVTFYTRRMLAYSLYECNADSKTTDANKKGLEELERFFAMAPADKVAPYDYKYRGLHYSKLGMDSLALLDYQKAISMDPIWEKELSGLIAKIYYKAKKYDDAIKYYEIKKAGKASNLNVTEHYELGRAYYFGPQNYALADSSLRQVTEQSANFASGYLWRARANYKLDPTNAQWLAKPFYETYLEKLTPEDKANTANKGTQIEAAKYLGDYYVNSKEGKDLTKAKMYWKMVLDLEPTDPQAKAFMASPAGR